MRPASLWSLELALCLSCLALPPVSPAALEPPNPSDILLSGRLLGPEDQPVAPSPGDPAGGRPRVPGHVNLKCHGEGVPSAQTGARFGDDGRFSFDRSFLASMLAGSGAENPARCWLEAWVWPFAPVERGPFEWTGEPFGDFELRLAPGSRVGGRIRGLTAALPRVRVVANRVEPEGAGLSVPGEVDPDGSYRIASLGPGVWEVAAYFWADPRMVRRRIHVTPDLESLDLDLDLDKGSDFRVRVLRNGEPLDSPYLALALYPNLFLVPSSRDLEGGFTFLDVGAGPRTLVIRELRLDFKVSRKVVLPIEDELVIDVAAAEVQGRLLREDGSPAGRGEIFFRPVRGSEASLTRAWIQEDGRFSAVLMKGGRYWLTAETRDGDWLRQRVKVKLPSTDLGDLRAQPGTPLMVTVRRADGRPLAAPDFILFTREDFPISGLRK